MSENKLRHELWNRLKQLSHPNKPSISYFNSSTNIKNEINRLLNNKLTNRHNYTSEFNKKKMIKYKHDKSIPPMSYKEYEEFKPKQYKLINPVNYNIAKKMEHIRSFKKKEEPKESYAEKMDRLEKEEMMKTIKKR